MKIAKSLDDFLAQRPGLEFELAQLCQSSPKCDAAGVQWVIDTIAQMRALKEMHDEKYA